MTLQWKTWSYIYDQSHMPNYTTKLLIWPIIWPKTNTSDTTNYMTNSPCIWPIIWPQTNKVNTTNYMIIFRSQHEYDQLYDQFSLPTWIRPMTWPIFVANMNTTNYMTISLEYNQIYNQSNAVSDQCINQYRNMTTFLTNYASMYWIPFYVNIQKYIWPIS